MNTFASGSSKEARALVLALALPGMLTTWMLNQPAILGQVSADKNPIAAISDIGLTVVNQNISFDARASYDLNANSNTLHYTWDFGDGSNSKATGIAVNHVYTTPGSYTLTLTVSSTKGSRRVSKVLNIVPQSTSYDNPYASYKANGVPPPNSAVILPTPNDIPSSQVIPTATATTPSLSSSVSPALVFIPVAVGICIIILLVALLIMNRRRHHKNV
ncbi:MAG TPA: hypothetical protein DCL75_21520 [Ktedonobacter sp.]|nr:hypothetical protein [Ktedonobacter sp.]HAT45383.1 hypothetical protein [Ktedonobacter sp.]HCF87672.1 hypothetical protein [Ktedonobacter sp.]